MRPPLTERMLRLAEHWATWSTCHVKHGAVLAWRNEVLATGFNGAPKGEPHCVDVGCDLHRGHCKRTIHAEANAISRAIARGVFDPGNGYGRWKGGRFVCEEITLYVTGSPCRDCQEEIERVGIGRVVFRDFYAGVIPSAKGVVWVKWGWGEKKQWTGNKLLKTT